MRLRYFLPLLILCIASGLTLGVRPAKAYDCQNYPNSGGCPTGDCWDNGVQNCSPFPYLCSAETCDDTNPGGCNPYGIWGTASGCTAYECQRGASFCPCAGSPQCSVY
jgi:hypothetical protein